MTGPSYRVVAGPLLLAGLEDGPGLEAHRHRHGALAECTAKTIQDLAARRGLLGRGGAGFPFATKFATVVAASQDRGSLRRRPLVVVNAAEGEPASCKDEALVTYAPHRVLDGAALAARALDTREVHVVVGEDRPRARAALDRALAERRAAGESLRWRLHVAAAAFVAGHESAVLELLAGREGLPVTRRAPAARRGHRQRPTLLSNAETFAQLWAAVVSGAWEPALPDTVLLTISDGVPGGGRRVVEVPAGTPWEQVLDTAQIHGPVLVGGYHGTWAAPAALRGLAVDRVVLRDAGLSLGAGVVIALPPGACPLRFTAAVTAYLASQSARRCGPCRFGLPALADALVRLAEGPGGDRPRIEQLLQTVRGRGACAHPDGTAGLVASLLRAYPAEVRAHLADRCLGGGPDRPRAVDGPFGLVATGSWRRS